MSRQENNSHKKLKELLDQKAQDNGAMDDFEREALDGFALLENEKKALDLKEKLDNRIYAEMFTEKKNSPARYWYAAAGLLLVIGFSVYFLRILPPKKQDLAVHSPLREEVVTSPPPEKKEPEPAFVQAPQAPSALKAIPKKQENAPEQELKVTAAEDYAPANRTSEPVAMAEKGAPVIAPVPVNSAAGIETMSKKEMQKEEKEDLAAFSAKDAPAPKSTTDELKRKSIQTASQPAPASSPGFNAPGAPTCAYTGGETALNKDLRQALDEKQLLQKFDATLFINTKTGKVEKVVFTNSYDLSKAQQKEISAVLKELNKFCTSGDGKKTAEYKIAFRP